MAAALRLPQSMSAEEKEAAADALIRRLGLTSSADTPVGELGAWSIGACIREPAYMWDAVQLYVQSKTNLVNVAGCRGCQEEGSKRGREEAVEHRLRAAGQPQAPVPG